SYIIDGFNLVHKIPSLKTCDDPYTGLINYIKKNKLSGSKNNKVMIIFDGWANYLSSQEKEFKIIFSGDNTADDLIKKRLEKIDNISEVVVVSDDHEVRHNAKKQGARLCSTVEFMSKRIKKKTDYSQDKEIDYNLQKEINEELKKIWLKE
ncbi:MAG: NYN domain-containing protein, partial [Candidatus Omnitrophica bacterium]|nr:NYN domain-containing protein [Candidatus Omnitrophota bacterium]